jgi:F-box domain
MRPDMFEVFFLIFAIYQILNVCIDYRWPTPSSISVTEYKRFDHALPQRYFFEVLPLEILLEVLADCSVSAIVNLSSTCRSCRNFFMAPEILNTILRAAVLSPTGSLRSVTIHGHAHSY